MTRGRGRRLRKPAVIFAAREARAPLGIGSSVTVPWAVAVRPVRSTARAVTGCGPLGRPAVSSVASQGEPRSTTAVRPAMLNSTRLSPRLSEASARTPTGWPCGTCSGSELIATPGAAPGTTV